MNNSNEDKVMAVIKNIRITLSNIQIYPEESDFIKQSVSLCFELLKGVLADSKKLVIGESENKIIVNGRPLKFGSQEEMIAEKFAEAMKVCEIHSFLFDENINEESLKEFLYGLAKKMKFETGGFAEGITVTEKAWVSVGKKDLVIEEGKEFAEGMEGGVKELTQRIKELATVKGDADVFDSKYEQLKKRMAQQMENIPADTLLSFLGQDSLSEETLVKEDASKMLSVGKFGELIKEIGLRKKELAEKDKELDKQSVQFQKLKKSLGFILNMAKEKGVSQAVCDDLISSEVMELLPEDWAENISSGWLSFTKQVEDLIKNDDLLFDKSMQEKLPELIKNLDLSGKDEYIEKLLEKTTTSLVSGNEKIKKESVNLFAKIYPAVESCSNKEIFKKNMDKLFLSMEKQTDLNSYKKLASTLTKLAVQAFKLGDSNITLNIISVFKKHASFAFNKLPEREKTARMCIKDFSESEAVKVMISDFLSNQPDRQKVAAQLAIKLGLPVVDTIIQTIKQTLDLRTRKVLAMVIKDISNEAIDKLFASIEDTVVWDNITRVIGVLDSVGHREIVINKLREMSGHYNPSIRRATLFAFKSLKDERLEEKAIELLNDEDMVVKRQAIIFLRKLKSRAAIKVLIELAKELFESKETIVLEEICITLGELQAEDAIDIFKELLLPERKLLFIRKKKYPLSLRITVLKSLAKFHHRNKEVKSILEKLTKDEDSIIKRKSIELLSNNK